MKLLDKYILNCRSRVTFPEKIRFKLLCNGNPVLLNEGFRMYLNPGDNGLSRQLWCRGLREPVCTMKYKELLRDNMTILDIGSNIGYYVLVALQKMKHGKIFCFEPHPDNFNMLQKNLALNNVMDKCEIYNKAIVDNDNDFAFISNGGKHLNWCKISNKGIRVDATNLKNTSISFDVVKMDIEGYEYKLVPSMDMVFRKCKYVYIELHPFLIEQQYGDKWYNVVDVLRDCSLFPFYVVKEFGSYFEVGFDCNKNNFYELLDLIGVDKNYTCGLGLFFKNDKLQ